MSPLRKTLDSVYKPFLSLCLGLCLLNSPISASAQTAGQSESENQLVPIYEIQGSHFRSAYQGQKLLTRGIVTAIGKWGFYLQDPEGDQNPITSDGIFVRQQASTVQVGDFVGVYGTVYEEEVQDKSIGLSRTTLIAEYVERYRMQKPPPKPTLLGKHGRTIPKAHISQFQGDLNKKNALDLLDGLDFFESLEGMLVEIESPRLSAAGSAYGDLFMIANQGQEAFPSLNRRHSLLLFVEAQDYNPEILTIKNPHSPDVDMSQLPPFKATDYQKGDLFQGNIRGILDFNISSRPGFFVGGYFVYPTQTLPPVQTADLKPEYSALKSSERQLTVANYNLENFTQHNPWHNPDKAQGIARHIVKHLNSPDILMLQEVADNDGYIQKSDITAADQTLRFLIDEIKKAGGPVYDFVEIAPENGQDGGLPNANIRVAYLYKPARVQLLTKPEGDTHTPVDIDLQGHLSLNPGRVAPNHPSFINGRKTLAVEFIFKNQSIILLNNHLKSKRGDGSLWSAYQPPIFHSETQRIKQTQVLHDFVSSILEKQPKAHIILAGDFNDFYASKSLKILKGKILKNLVEDLPFNERYTYVYKGSSQTLDHIFVSPEIYQHWQPEVDIVHLNAEFSEQNLAESDHDPILTRFTLPD